MAEQNSQNKSSKGIIIAVIIIVVLIAAYFTYSTFSSKPSVSGNVVASNQNIKLADSKFAKSSYLISGETLSNDVQNAISGFNLTREVLADGRINITLVALNPEYSNQNYVIAQNYSLHFIESTFGDDSPPNGENPSLMDDHAVVVDPDGYVLSGLPSR